MLKEADLEVVQTQLKQLRVKPRLPAHVILNNRTLTVFSGESYESVVFSVPLSDIMLQANWTESKESCFVVKNTRAFDQIVLCAITGARDPSKDKKEWLDAIQLFKSKCYEGMKIAPSEDIDPIIAMKKADLEEEELEQTSAGGATVDNKASANMAKDLEDLQKLAMNVYFFRI